MFADLPAARHTRRYLSARRLRGNARKQRQLHVERLEDRRLLAFADFEPSSCCRPTARAWERATCRRSSGRASSGPSTPGTGSWPWTACQESHTATEHRRSDAPADASGPALNALRSLGGRGSLLIETAPT